MDESHDPFNATGNKVRDSLTRRSRARDADRTPLARTALFTLCLADGWLAAACPALLASALQAVVHTQLFTVALIFPWLPGPASQRLQEKFAAREAEAAKAQVKKMSQQAMLRNEDNNKCVRACMHACMHAA